MNRKPLNAESKTADIAQGRPTLAILPLGATEQQSKHLPLLTDTLIAEQVSLAVAKRLGAYCLPALPYSVSHMHRGSEGSIWLSNKTLWLVLEDIATGVLDSGIQNFLILNGHGGNQLLPAVVQDLNLNIPGLFSFTHDSFAGRHESGLFAEYGGLSHADEYETSLVWHLRQDLVDPALLVDQPEVLPGDSLRYAPFRKIADLTHTGRPTLASPEKGAAIFEFVVNKTCAEIERVMAVKKGIEARKVRGL